MAKSAYHVVPVVGINGTCRFVAVDVREDEPHLYLTVDGPYPLRYICPRHLVYTGLHYGLFDTMGEAQAAIDAYEREGRGAA